MRDKIIDPRESKTFKRKAPKIQRNVPCKCGSGRKYKNCCEIRERLSEQKAIREIRAKEKKR